MRHRQIHTDTFNTGNIHTDICRYIQIHTRGLFTRGLCTWRCHTYNTYRYIQIHTDTYNIHDGQIHTIQSDTVQIRNDTVNIDRYIQIPPRLILCRYILIQSIQTYTYRYRLLPDKVLILCRYILIQSIQTDTYRYHLLPDKVLIQPDTVQIQQKQAFENSFKVYLSACSCMYLWHDLSVSQGCISSVSVCLCLYLSVSVFTK